MTVGYPEIEGVRDAVEVWVREGMGGGRTVTWKPVAVRLWLWEGVGLLVGLKLRLSVGLGLWV